MIYKLRADRTQYLNFYISPEEIEARLGDYFLLDEPLWRDFWNPVEAEFKDDSDKGDVIVPPDITIWFTTNNLALNQKAYEVLSDELEPYGEFLPVTCAGNKYWLLHATRKIEIEAVDLKHSARTIDEGGFVEIQKLVFKQDIVNEQLVFMTAYDDYRNLYASQKFKSMIEEANLKGLVFSEDLISIL